MSDPTLTRETIYDGPEVTRPVSVVIDPASDDLVHVERDIDGFVVHVFARIAAAFLISAFFASYSDRLTDSVALSVSGQALIALIGGMLAVALVASRKVGNLPISVATATLIGYAALQGILFGLAFRTAYGCSFAPGYLSIAAIFGLLCLFGTWSGRDLTGLAPLFAGSVAALVVALGSIYVWDQKAVAALAACVQCWLTLALVGYHRDFIRDLPSSFENDPKWQKAAVIGALQIYLDVVLILIIIMQARWLSEFAEEQKDERRRSLL
ncbi:MAG TPA: Bax inhibitor-1 family protein [Terriglobales bacterium]|nr:Bax inhibitor-1 family protein [Terriglobales bacterium]